MLYYAVVFLVIALIAGALGFFGVAGAAVGIAKILFFVFLVLFVVSLLLGRRAYRTILMPCRCGIRRWSVTWDQRFLVDRSSEL